jgi:hypothetical protein
LQIEPGRKKGKNEKDLSGHSGCTAGVKFGPKNHTFFLDSQIVAAPLARSGYTTASHGAGYKTSLFAARLRVGLGARRRCHRRL